MSRNVEELNRLIGVWERDEIDSKHGGYPSLPDWLAQNGVLAVDSLTAIQCALVAGEGERLSVYDETSHPEAEKVRAALRRCATGDLE